MCFLCLIQGEHYAVQHRVSCASIHKDNVVFEELSKLCSNPSFTFRCQGNSVITSVLGAEDKWYKLHAPLFIFIS
jgi:hypothetical protein